MTDFFRSSGTYYDMALTDLDSDGLQDLLAASDGQGVKIWASQTQVRSLAAVTFGTARVPFPDKGEEVFPVDPKENDVFVVIDGRPQYRSAPKISWRSAYGRASRKRSIPCRFDPMA